MKGFRQRAKAARTSRALRLVALQAEDDLAAATSWQPFNTTSSNFNTQRVHFNRRRQRLALRPTVGGLAVAAAMAMFGLVPLWAMSPWSGLVFEPDIAWYWDALFVAICTGFCVIGLGTLRQITLPVVFDLRRHRFERQYWRSRLALSLDRLHALQLLPDYSGDYSVYQLNIVQSDGERVHLLDYASPRSIRSDAALLAMHLNCPVWDVI